MLLRNDELNNLKSEIEKNRGDISKLTDLMDDWLMLAYADGMTDVSEQLQGSPNASIERVMDVIYANVGGKTVLERLRADAEMDEIEDLFLLFDNERQRVYNTAAYDTATELGAKTKTWHTMKDNRVRDTHDYLEGMTKGINEEFSTYNGDSAQHPGGFNVASEDINCRCYLTYDN